MNAEPSNLRQQSSGENRRSAACSFFTRNGEKLVKLFIFSAGGIFLGTGLAKIISSFGIAPVLSFTDPLLGVSFRHVMLLVGALELILSTICLLGGNVRLKAGLVAWVATSFAVYHWGLSFIGWHQPCTCFGNITDVLRIAPATVNLLVKSLLAYLLVGGYLSLFFIFRRNKGF